jgi:hypothetical protein
MPSNSVLHPNLSLKRGLSPRSAVETEIDAAGFPAHTRRMAKKAMAKSSGGASVSASLQSTGTKTPAREDARPTSKTAKPSSLLDTRVIYCGDNLEQLAKLPDACVDLIYIDPLFNSNATTVRGLTGTVSGARPRRSAPLKMPREHQGLH